MTYQMVLGLVLLVFSLNSFSEVCDDGALDVFHANIVNLLKVKTPKCKAFPPVSSAPKITLKLFPSTPTMGARFDLEFTSTMNVKDVAGLKKTLAADFLNKTAEMVENFDTDMTQKVEVLTSTKEGYTTVSRNTRSPFPTKNFHSKCEIKTETETQFDTICKFDDSVGDTKEYVSNYILSRKCKKEGAAFSCTSKVIMAPKAIKRLGIEFASTNEVIQKGSLRALRSLVAQSILVNSKDKDEALEKYLCNNFEKQINDYLTKCDAKFVLPPNFTYN